MKRKRGHISLKVKCASLICELFQIPLEHAKAMHVDQVLALVNFDHYPIPHAAPFNGPDAHWNLVPRLIADHRKKTARHDTPIIAKTRRVSAAHEEFRKRLLAKAGQCEAPPKKQRWKDRKAQAMAARSARESRS